MRSETEYTVSGSSLRDLTVSTTHRRFRDDKVSTEVIDVPVHDPTQEHLSVMVEYGAGVVKAGSMRLFIQNGTVKVTDMNIKPMPRSYGLARFMLGIVYGVGVWAEVDEVWGILDYSKVKEEALINAGFPKSNIIVSQSTNAMFFSAKLSQIDYDPQNFTVVRQ